MGLDYLIIAFLLLLSALFSGLTLGLMSLDQFELRRKAKLGNKNAAKIYPLRRQGNLLLTTLLVGNVAVNSALAIFLGSLTQGVIAGLVATGLIVVFGEILPQSIFSRHALKLGARSVWLVYLFLYVLYPICKPIAMLLNKALGHELPTAFSKRELRMMLREQAKHQHSDLDDDEFHIIKGGLEIGERRVKEVMTPRKETYFLSSRTKLTRSKLVEIQQKGHSRVPIYNTSRRLIVGILYAKDLIQIDPGAGVLVTKIMRKKVRRIKENSRLDSVLERFRKHRVHLFIVNNTQGLFTGIITLEDVLEEIVGEIDDEHDHKISISKNI